LYSCRESKNKREKEGKGEVENQRRKKKKKERKNEIKKGRREKKKKEKELVADVTVWPVVREWRQAA
jgi:hypothetical protein